jgi:hypothetical protein
LGTSSLKEELHDESTVRRQTIRLLGSLPLIAQFARRLQIQRTVDRRCPSRSNARLTHGQVALAVIANRLTQPKAMYQILEWAQKWGVRETWGIDPDALNDDRLARCLDAVAPQIDAIQGEVLVQAVGQFDLELSQLHWDLTSVVLTGEYPPAEQAKEYPTPAYGFGGEAGCSSCGWASVSPPTAGCPCGITPWTATRRMWARWSPRWKRCGGRSLCLSAW